MIELEKQPLDCSIGIPNFMGEISDGLRLLFCADNNHHSKDVKYTFAALVTALNLRHASYEMPVDIAVNRDFYDYKIPRNDPITIHHFDIRDRDSRTLLEEFSQAAKDAIDAGDALKKLDDNPNSQEYRSLEGRLKVTRIEKNSIKPILNTRCSYRVHDEMAFNILETFTTIHQPIRNPDGSTNYPVETLAVLVGMGHLEGTNSLEKVLIRRITEDIPMLNAQGIKKINLVPIKDIDIEYIVAKTLTEKQICGEPNYTIFIRDVENGRSIREFNTENLDPQFLSSQIRNLVNEEKGKTRQS